MAGPGPTGVGVDFGTSTCFIARRRGSGPVEVAPLGLNRRYLPSLAGLKLNRLIVGEMAEMLTPDQLIRSIKRAITHDQARVRVGGRPDGPELARDEVVVAILTEIARRVRDRGLLDGGRVLRLGCPAMWEADQRQLILDLATEAGLPASHEALVEEPVAAGIAWLNGLPETVHGRLLVFDMGGGTLDIMVAEVAGGDRPAITVLTSVGLPVAGDALDEAIADDLRKELSEHGVDIASLDNPANAEGSVLDRATEAKIALSSVDRSTVSFPPRTFGGRRAPAIRYTRDRLEELFRPQMAAAEERIWTALRLARLTHQRGSSAQEIMRLKADALARDIRYVLLVGGMSRVPYVRRRLAELFPDSEIHNSAGVAEDEAIVAGLADTTGYNTVNLYRPGFDFELTWDGGSYPLYRAYTPLFHLNQIYGGQIHPAYVLRLTDRDPIPRQRQGEVRVRTATGEPAGLTYRGRQVDALPVRFGFGGLILTLHCDGRVHVIDGIKRQHEFRVDTWPVVRGTDSQPEPVPVSDPKVYYPFDRP